eukprot:CAMPEP_0201249830 /NCGR_PEP_ID=MMETSP0852-20130820/61223_1 /ASSEMBLY_ACC=CAM_ASM_000632 /TAXON_ID=183588 /ORGANISM="Pseudo-nitzschia fraudulenta, Strain WWA7" /LENGTH=248 /DNA_ID=CAMNT_0047548985 /DNA_START=9 /DNA_END=756 /DNA_ORIENTATION=-
MARSFVRARTGEKHAQKASSVPRRAKSVSKRSRLSPERPDGFAPLAPRKTIDGPGTTNNKQNDVGPIKRLFGTKKREPVVNRRISEENESSESQFSQRIKGTNDDHRYNNEVCNYRYPRRLRRRVRPRSNRQGIIYAAPFGRGPFTAASSFRILRSPLPARRDDPGDSVQSPPATTDIGNDLQRATDQAIEPFIVIGMKVVSSIGKMKKRHKDCQVVRRRGKIFVICKSNPRFKVRQGGAKMKKRQKK